MAETASLANAKDPFQLPSAEVLREIERKQDERAQAIRERRRRNHKGVKDDTDDGGRTAAAEIIQRNYRGHRERRAMKGFGLDPGTRWMEVCTREAGSSSCNLLILV